MPPTLAEAFMFSEHDVVGLDLRTRLKCATSLLDLLEADTTLTTREQARAATRLYAMFPDEVEHTVVCWAVVRSHAVMAPRDSVELGCVLKAQAEDLAAAIESYDGDYHRHKGWAVDSYRIAKRAVPSEWIAREDLTGAAYVKMHAARFGAFR